MYQMADKKISELQDVSEFGGIDYDNDYTIALRGFQNYKIKIGDIVSETKSLIPENVSDFFNDAGYVTRLELSTKGYITRSDIPKYLSDFEDNIGLATKDELNQKTNELENRIESSADALENHINTSVSTLENHVNTSVSTLENYINTSVSEIDVAINNINITIENTKGDIVGVLDEDYFKNSELPNTNVSVFINDCEYVTLANLQQQTATDEEVSSMVSEILNGVY